MACVRVAIVCLLAWLGLAAVPIVGVPLGDGVADVAQARPGGGLRSRGFRGRSPGVRKARARSRSIGNRRFSRPRRKARAPVASARFGKARNRLRRRSGTSAIGLGRTARARARVIRLNRARGLRSISLGGFGSARKRAGVGVAFGAGLKLTGNRGRLARKGFGGVKGRVVVGRSVRAASVTFKKGRGLRKVGVGVKTNRRRVRGTRAGRMDRFAAVPGFKVRDVSVPQLTVQ